MASRKRPSEAQLAAGLAIQQLAWGRRSVPHCEAFDHLCTLMPYQRAYEIMQSRLLRRALPPGCRMTATHFVFD